MKEIRNPFLMIGKVIKYEWLYLYRKLVPVFGVALVLALFAGFSVNKTIEKSKVETIKNETVKWQASGNLNVKFMNQNVYSTDTIIINSDMQNGGSAVVFAIIINLVLLIVTISIIKNRFSKGMLEEEAYVNFILPVTVGEHLWGRFIAYFVCGLACFIVFILVVVLCGLPFFKSSNSELLQNLISGFNFSYSGIAKIITVYICFWSLISTLVFFIKSFDLYLKKHRGIIKFGILILVLMITGYIMDYFDFSNFWISLLIPSLFFSALYFTGAYLLFKLELNLE